MSEKIKHQIAVINRYLKNPGNHFCADCKRPSPTWASINLGVFVCIKCSGCHREIGVHVTKIKSINLDLWPSNILNNFGKINNVIANEYWEFSLKDFDFSKIQDNDFRLQDFIRDKYERKRYINKKVPEPMALILQGHDLIKEYDSKPHIENQHYEEPERHFRQKNINKPKGKSFGIVSKPEDKNTPHQDHQEHHENNQQSNQYTSNNTEPSNTNSLIDLEFGDQSSTNSNNLPKKDSGFSFIKKKNTYTVPAKTDTNPQPITDQKSNSSKSAFKFIKNHSKTPQPAQTQQQFINPLNPQITIQQQQPPQESQKSPLFQVSPQDSKPESYIPESSESLVDIYNIQVETSETIKNLSSNLKKAYDAPKNTQPNQPQYNNAFNYPGGNMNGYYINPYQNNMGMGMNYGYPNYMNNYNNNNNVQRSILTQPFNIELYNDPNKKQPEIEQKPFTYNTNYSNNILNKEDKDPFKSLVSF